MRNGEKCVFHELIESHKDSREGQRIAIGVFLAYMLQTDRQTCEQKEIGEKACIVVQLKWKGL